MDYGKYILIIILLIIGSVILYSINIPIEIIITIFAIFITIFIASTQVNQLNKLEDIGIQTKETTEKLRTDSTIRKIINKFFSINEKGKKFKLFFPVEYYNRPLPLINQGDFYAIHVLSTRIGEDNLDLEAITKDFRPSDIASKEDAIYICAPHANPALKNIYEIKEIKDDEDEKQLKSEKWPLERLDLPCWFVEDYRDVKKKWITRKIWIYKTGELLESPAEPCYKAAKELDEGIGLIHKPTIQQDYGIFARINKNNNQYFIIAGIHQYGTWIVANFLSNLLGGKEVDYKSTFLSKKDFIAVVWGDFDNKKLTIDDENMGILKKYIWTKEDDIWVPVKKKNGQQNDK